MVVPGIAKLDVAPFDHGPLVDGGVRVGSLRFWKLEYESDFLKTRRRKNYR